MQAGASVWYARSLLRHTALSGDCLVGDEQKLEEQTLHLT